MHDDSLYRYMCTEIHAYVFQNSFSYFMQQCIHIDMHDVPWCYLEHAGFILGEGGEGNLPPLGFGLSPLGNLF